jgi:nitroimidazol reductase NimA-like FMN-containing flavoprotein (pyridoxamine 5'-phosphate oxidase superfamily)
MTEVSREIRRKPHRSVEEMERICAILDDAYVAHLGFNDPDTGEATVIPLGYVRDGDRLLFHGSTGSRLFMALKSGVQVCATRSVMVFGVTTVLEESAKSDAMKALTEKLIPGLWTAGRPMTTKEFAATMIVSLPLDDVTAKQRKGEALDDEEDVSLEIWAGQIPITMNFGEPITNQNSAHVAVPDYIKNIAAQKD